MALSASDGSAFVTKAEFDSALSDVNARLSTFEMGINSKIESQVYYYLEKNGIKVFVDNEIEKYLNENNKCGNCIFCNIINSIKKLF